MIHKITYIPILNIMLNTLYSYAILLLQNCIPLPVCQGTLHRLLLPQELLLSILRACHRVSTLRHPPSLFLLPRRDGLMLSLSFVLLPLCVPVLLFHFQICSVSL